MAGESAGRLARRHRERTTESILDGLHADGWAVFHDVRLPGRDRTQVDHVVVGPPGVFVIDSKDWAGRIEIQENKFWCRGRRQDRVLGTASETGLVIAGLVSGPAANTVRSALCFVREEPIAGWCHDVMLCSTANLREMLVGRPPMLTGDEVTLASIELDLGFRAAAQGVPAEPKPPSRAPRVPRLRRRELRGSRLVRRGLMRLSVFLLLAILVMSQLPRLTDLREGVVGRVKDILSPAQLMPEVAYESCDAVRAIYPNGVGTADGVRDATRRRPLPDVQAEVYRASAALDKDGDGVVCERGR